MFIVIEMQVNSDGTVGTLIDKFEREADAESKYHTILAAAAISNVPKHSAIILTDEAMMHSSQCYKHEEPANDETTNI